MNSDWQKLFTKEAAVIMFTDVFKRQPDYSSEDDMRTLQYMETSVAKFIPIIQNLFK